MMLFHEWCIILLDTKLSYTSFHFKLRKDKYIYMM